MDKTLKTLYILLTAKFTGINVTRWPGLPAEVEKMRNELHKAGLLEEMQPFIDRKPRLLRLSKKGDLLVKAAARSLAKQLKVDVEEVTKQLPAIKLKNLANEIRLSLFPRSHEKVEALLAAVEAL